MLPDQQESLKKTPLLTSNYSLLNQVIYKFFLVFLFASSSSLDTQNSRFDVIIRSTGSLGNVEFKKADEELPVVKETCLKRRCMSPHNRNMSE